jgi:hypothetical protein
VHCIIRQHASYKIGKSDEKSAGSAIAFSAINLNSIAFLERKKLGMLLETLLANSLMAPA